MPKLPIGDIGPCEVTWDYDGVNPLVITPYLGKVSHRMSDAVTDVHKDGQGIAPVESFFEGTTVELEIPMTRSTLLQLATTIGYRGMGILNPAGTVLTLHNIAGVEMYANAKQIVIKPICNNVPDTDPSTWTLLYKCHPWRDFELTWDRSGQRIHMVKFKVFPNQDSGYEGEYFQEGMEEIPDFVVTSSNRYLDYEEEIFVVTSSNKYLDYKEIAEVENFLTATMDEGGYTGDELAAEIQEKMQDVAVHYHWLVTYSNMTHKFTIGHQAPDPAWWPFVLRWQNGPHGSAHENDHIGTLIGFDDATDDSGAGPFTSDFANGRRITATMDPGGYNGDTLAAEIEAKMNDVAILYTWQVSYSAVTRKFTITNSDGWIFGLRWQNGPHGSAHENDHIGTLIGFDDATDDTGANSYISDNEVPP